MNLPDVRESLEHFQGNNGLAEYLAEAIGPVQTGISITPHLAFAHYKHKLARYQVAIEHYLLNHGHEVKDLDVAAALEKLEHTVHLLGKKASLDLRLSLHPQDVVKQIAGERSLQIATRKAMLYREQLPHHSYSGRIFNHPRETHPRKNPK